MNFLQGGTAINVFCRQNNIDLKIVDAGVAFDFEPDPHLIHAEVSHGTKSFLTQKAMDEAALTLCLQKRSEVVQQVAKSGCNIIGFGEIGIGNTSAAALLMNCVCDFPIEQCLGRGTGVNDDQFLHKINILSQAKSFHGNLSDPKEVSQTFGGLEMAQMCGAMLEAYEQNMLIMVDGFIASSVFLVVQAIQPEIKNNALFCHLSDEAGHRLLLNFLNVTPILQLHMRLGEGTGCALAYPIIQSDVAFLNEMASFESAGVNQKNE